MKRLLSLILIMTLLMSLCCFGTAYAEETKPSAAEAETEAAETKDAPEKIDGGVLDAEDEAEEADEFADREAKPADETDESADDAEDTGKSTDEADKPAAEAVGLLIMKDGFPRSRRRRMPLPTGIRTPPLCTR